MMRVMHLISSSGYFGADNMLIELAKALKGTSVFSLVGVFRNEHNPHVEIAEVAGRHGLPAEIFPCKGRVDIRTVLRIRRFLKEEKIDLIHTHGYKSNLYALAATVGMQIGRMATCHNWLGDDMKMRSYAKLDKILLGRFDRIVAVSDSIRVELRSARLPPSKLATIYNGVDLERFQVADQARTIKEEFGIPEGFKVIGTVGRLAPEKGHTYFVEAARELLEENERLVFMIVGDGPLRGQLERQAAEEKDRRGNILFTGTREDMERVYAAMDVFVLPSLTEGIPMALLEAMASRKAVVATGVGGVPTIIEDGFSGRLVKSRNAKGLATAIKSLLHDPEKAEELGENAYQSVKEAFSSDGMARRYKKIYEEIVCSNREEESPQLRTKNG